MMDVLFSGITINTLFCYYYCCNYFFGIINSLIEINKNTTHNNTFITINLNIIFYHHTYTYKKK